MLRNIDFDIDLQAKVRDLPVSQKQMLEIAIALSKNAKGLIMDEPTAALSRKETETLFKTIADIKARGIGIIYISHKLEEVKQIGDRITVLRDGAKIATVAAKDADLHQIISLMIGKELSRSHAARGVQSGDEVSRVEGLSNRQPLRPGQFRRAQAGNPGHHRPGRLGQDRAGARHFRRGSAERGHRAPGGRPVRIDSPRKAVGLGIGYLPEDRDADGLCLNLGVKENVSMVLLAKLKGLLFSATRRDARCPAWSTPWRSRPPGCRSR